MPKPDHQAVAIHATPISAQRAVGVLLAVVVLLAAAVAIVDALSKPCPPTTARPTVPGIRHLVLITPLDRHLAVEARPSPGSSPTCRPWRE